MFAEVKVSLWEALQTLDDGRLFVCLFVCLSEQIFNPRSLCEYCSPVWTGALQHSVPLPESK